MNQEVLDECLKADCGEAAINDPKITHVYLLFADGEVSCTKNQDLFGVRILHLNEHPKFFGKEYPFPHSYFPGVSFPCIVLRDMELALQLRAKM